MENNLICPSCKFLLSQELFFCPNCGKKLKEKPVSTTILRQIVIYLVSFFLAPFGLAWAFKYLRQNDPVAKGIGIAVIIITVLAVVVTIKVTSSFYTSLYSFPGLTDIYQ